MNRKEQKELNEIMKKLENLNPTFQEILRMLFARIICLESQVALLSDQVNGVDD